MGSVSSVVGFVVKCRGDFFTTEGTEEAQRARKKYERVAEGTEEARGRLASPLV